MNTLSMMMFSTSSTLLSSKCSGERHRCFPDSSILRMKLGVFHYRAMILATLLATDGMVSRYTSNYP